MRGDLRKYMFTKMSLDQIAVFFKNPTIKR